MGSLHQGHFAGCTSRGGKKINNLSFFREFMGQILRELSFSHRLFAWLYKYNTCLRKEQQSSF